MSTPPPVGPVQVPLRTPPPRPSTAAPNSGKGFSAFLATRNGKIAAAVGVVVLFALYQRYKTNSAAAAAATTAASTAVPTANTTATDLYSQLEPLVEQASGFQGTQSILAQLQSLQNSLTTGQKTGAGTPGASGALFPNQTHRVGQVGQNYNLMQLIHAYYPTANAQQQKEIGYATIANDRALGTGVVPGGKQVTFYSQAVK